MAASNMEDDPDPPAHPTSKRTPSSSQKTASNEPINPSFASRFPAPPPTLPSEQSKDRLVSTMAQFGADSTLGQFSFAPATQTTVVTTTTTTTTRFPPFVMRAPRRMQDLDPKLYPLASTPTPSSLKRISFDLQGKQTIFKEAEDTTVAMEELEQEHEILKSNGAIQTMRIFKNEPRDCSSPYCGNRPQRKVPRLRPASPDSIVGHPEDTRSTRSTTASRRLHSSSTVPSSLPHLRNFRRDDPATPEIDLRERRRKGRRLSASNMAAGAPHAAGSTLSPSASKQITPPTLGSFHDMASSRPGSSHGYQTTPSGCRPPAVETHCPVPSFSASQTSTESVVPTPPIQGDEPQFVVPPVKRNLSSIPSRLALVDTSIAQALVCLL
jgi:hypothetical protein